ncbi:MAG: hypothetical protein ACMVP2_19475 [Imperialibacter sp.]|uniref:hypothetical protein n=1 Tax=Imperialibacter sp. TaxID=2038411 RepID=UPI003A8B0289
MKGLQILVVILALASVASHGQTPITYPLKEDVATIEGLMKASYEVVSGEAGQPRQWERDRSLHHPKAVYSFPVKGTNEQLTMTLKEFHGETDDLVTSSGFYEYEIDRRVQRFGNMAHVWSAYETRTEKDGPVVARGINSVQLYFDGQRWWIVSWVFDRERPDNPLPGKL